MEATLKTSAQKMTQSLTLVASVKNSEKRQIEVKRLLEQFVKFEPSKIGARLPTCVGQ